MKIERSSIFHEHNVNFSTVWSGEKWMIKKMFDSFAGRCVSYCRVMAAVLWSSYNSDPWNSWNCTINTNIWGSSSLNIWFFRNPFKFLRFTTSENGLEEKKMILNETKGNVWKNSKTKYCKTRNIHGILKFANFAIGRNSRLRSHSKMNSLYVRRIRHSMR